MPISLVGMVFNPNIDFSWLSENQSEAMQVPLPFHTSARCIVTCVIWYNWEEVSHDAMHGTYSVTEMRGNNLQEQLKLETKHEDYKCIAKYKLTVSEAVAFILKCPHATEITMTSVYSFPGLIQLLPQDRFFCLWEEKKTYPSNCKLFW